MALTYIQEEMLDDSKNACKAWVNFNGTGTVAIRDSYNVTSITDNGTGDYTVNFTNAMSDANYCFCMSVGDGTSGTRNIGLASAPAAASLNVITALSTTGAASDEDYISVAIFGA